jgi:hypothetical protein
MITILAAYLWRMVLNKQFEGSSWYHLCAYFVSQNDNWSHLDVGAGFADIRVLSCHLT